MKAKFKFVITVIFLLFQMTHLYNINNYKLISEIDKSTKPCIKLLKSVLKSLSADDQLAIYNSLSDDEIRCFDPSKYRKNLKSNLMDLNSAYGETIETETNKQIIKLECLISAAKSLFSEEEIANIKNILMYVTPYGLYPTKNRCIASFILNTNYILAKRRNFLFTKTIYIENFGITDSEDLIVAFPWKKSERDFIVNEFLRLDKCLTDYSSGMINPLVEVLNKFANSSSCGINPGSLENFYYYYGYYEFKEQVPIAISNDGSYNIPYVPEQHPLPESTSSSIGSPIAQEKPIMADSSQNLQNISSDPVYDPCYLNSGSSSAGSGTTISNDVITFSMPINSISTDNTGSSQKVFCPNFFGKNLEVWESTFYDGAQITDAFSMTSEAKSIIEDISICVANKNPNLDGLIFLNEIGSKYGNSRLQPNLISMASNFLVDTSALNSVNELIDKITSGETLSDFTLTCFEGVCKCSNCPSPINFSYSLYDWKDKKSDRVVYYASIPSIFYILVTKCNGNYLYFALIQLDSFSLIDIKYKTENSSSLINLNDQYFNKMFSCIKENSENSKTSDICSSTPFSQITPNCKKEISKKCNSADLPLSLEDLAVGIPLTKECDYTMIDLNNKTQYEKLKENCFQWINKNLLSASLYLNPEALIWLNKLKSEKGEVRFLQNSEKNSITYIDENNIVDQDTDFSEEAKYGSYGEIDIDGSSNIYYRIAINQPLIAYSADANQIKSPAMNESANTNAPPTLSSSIIYINYLMVIVYSIIFLI